MTEMSEDYRRVTGRTCESKDRERQASVATERNSSSKGSDVMQEVVRRENLKQALKRVCANKGAAGVDRMEVDALTPYLKVHWPAIREELLNGTYDPQPVLRVAIPKQDGRGMRALGIPTVLDRFIQQAILQVLTPIFDPPMSEHSYGFRPGRSCHQAVKAARMHVEAGYRYVVDTKELEFHETSIAGLS
jgi:RNA-directed DNA polymerase